MLQHHHKPSIANRNAILSRMFPDAHCDFEDTDFFARSMWTSFVDQREEHAHLNDSDDESEAEPKPKKSKAESSKGKSSVIDSDEDSPPREPRPPVLKVGRLPPPAQTMDSSS